MTQNRLTIYLLLSSIILINACTKSAPWPTSPLYDFSKYENEQTTCSNLDSIKQQLVGHYAHYDIVAYEDSTTRSPMFTFIISYGFTDFYLDKAGDLIQSDRFLWASHKINQKTVSTEFSDEAVQAIKPRNQKVEVNLKDGKWHVFRPPTPTLLGIDGDPSKPLSKDPNDPNLTDPDADGNPGVTVKIKIGKVIKGKNLHHPKRNFHQLSHLE